jgi:transketolase
MGMAEFGSLFYGEILKHNPAESKWINRDRFVLSAGHGSMFLYSLLHLSGYRLTLDDLKNFRQLGSKTPGHPEFGHTDGVETTTGPLGNGFANAVGMAISESMLAARFNRPGFNVFDHYTYSLAGDGCMMEGVSSEAASLAGHLGLEKLIVFYDSNRISIEGSTELAFTEDVGRRFEAYNWAVYKCSAYDFKAIFELVEKAKKTAGKPKLIILESVIGRGAPSKEGSHEVHGAPLGADEIKAAKKAMGIDENAQFFIHPEAAEYFSGKRSAWKKAYEEWLVIYEKWGKEYPQAAQELSDALNGKTLSMEEAGAPVFAAGEKLATRAASGKALKAYAKAYWNLAGGSADLAPSNNTALPEYGSYTKENRAGRTIHFGVREHAMAAVCNGIAAYGIIRPFCATFLVFADYLRPSVRLAALMKLPVIYILTHDSVFVGEDGPTHQPVEHLASLRIIPNVTVLRPADAEETVMAWQLAMEKKNGPVVLALTRQNLAVFAKHDADWKNTVRRGAYIVKEAEGPVNKVVAATGSEVELVLKALELAGEKNTRVISVLCKEALRSQPEDFKRKLIPAGTQVYTAEAGVRFGWEGCATKAENMLSIDRFGESGPGEAVAKYLGLTAENMAEILKR